MFGRILKISGSERGVVTLDGPYTNAFREASMSEHISQIPCAEQPQQNFCVMCGRPVSKYGSQRGHKHRLRVDLRFCSAKCKLDGVHIRFWDGVNKDGPEHPTLGKCWVITTRFGPAGYGLISVYNKRVLCHRFSYELEYGPIPEGLDILHKCDNPPCVNPAHLFAGTHKENMNDRDRKGRLGVEKRLGENAGSAILTEEQVREIRSIYRKGVIGKGTYVIARKFGVSASTIYAIVKGEHWRHVQ